MNNNKNEIIEIIKGELIKFETVSSGSGKFNIASNILFLRSNVVTNEFDKDCYLIAKKLIDYNISAVNENNYGYDFIDHEKIYKCIAFFKDEMKLNILNCYKRSLKNGSFDSDIKWIDTLIVNVKLDIYSKNNERIKYLLLCSASSASNIAATLLITFILTAISLSDFFVKTLGILEFKKKAYINHSMINHLVNTTSVIFKLDPDVTVKPTNYIGVASLLVYKVLIFIFIFNYIKEEIKKKVF